MKKAIRMIYAVSFFLLTVFFAASAENAYAVPAFARQTGMACNSCHFQHFPLLNEFGRSFKAGGYTAIGGQSLIEGDFLSLPSVLNASLVTKIMYRKTNGDSKLVDERNSGELQFPNEGAILFGGRVGEHVGFLFETQLVEEGEVAWASFKVPYMCKEVKGVTLNIVPFTTDAAGAAYGFELLNTGAVRVQRSLEHRTETSAQQYVGTATAATGFAFVASNPMGYINFTAWSPEHVNTDAAPYLKYYRAVLTPKVGTWDLAIGGQVWDGETKYTEDVTTEVICTGVGLPIAACAGVGDDVDVTTAARTNVKADAWAIDAQAQGNVSGLPLGVYLTYAVAEKTGTGAVPNLFNSSATDDRKAWTALVELGVMPGKITVAAAYRHGETGAAANDVQNATTLGATYLLAQNVEVMINHTWYGGSYYDLAAKNEGDIGDRLATLMIFAGF